MKFTIYGLRIASNGQVLSIGQTHQRLTKRLEGHVRRPHEGNTYLSGIGVDRGKVLLDALLYGDDGKDIFPVYGSKGDKPAIIREIYARGDSLEIFVIEEFEDPGRYQKAGNYYVASDMVSFREQYWKTYYLLRGNKPMLVDGALVRKFALQEVALHNVSPAAK